MAKSKGIGLATAVPKPDTDAFYKARNDMDTLRQAEEIKMDRGRHGAAKKMAKYQAKALLNIGKKK